MRTNARVGETMDQLVIQNNYVLLAGRVSHIRDWLTPSNTKARWDVLSHECECDQRERKKCRLAPGLSPRIYKYVTRGATIRVPAGTSSWLVTDDMAIPG